MKLFSKSIFLFHRDLRLDDNIGLKAAAECSDKIFPLFIFDDRQLEDHPFRSLPGLRFMIESLAELTQELSNAGSALSVFRGPTAQVLEAQIKAGAINAVFSNYDYTPFARARDLQLAELCRKHTVEFRQCHDALLLAPGAVLKSDGAPYTVYTAFRKACEKRTIPEPAPARSLRLSAEPLSGSDDTLLDTFLPAPLSSPAALGGRAAALKILDRISDFADYDARRNIPKDESGTTRLSAHLKFGTVSPRELFHRVLQIFGPQHTLLAELRWRDFFTHIAAHFPHVFEGAFHRRYNSIAWEDNSAHLDAWRSGMTGFPIVDAGMRELAATGYMHNRVRMITGSFLTKDLLISWREGERYFARQLIDYDPAVNNGNWQWVASTGCDAQPYFRIFNPWLQGEKFDPDCVYIKRWVPELSDCTAAEIHHGGEREDSIARGYPPPIVDHQHQKAIAEELFRAAAGR